MNRKHFLHPKHIMVTLNVLNDIWRTNAQDFVRSKPLHTDLDNRDKILFWLCKIRLGRLCSYMDKYKGRHVSAITFSIYQLYLRALSPEHFLCFEAVAVSPHEKSSHSVAVAPIARRILSHDCAAPPAHEVCACMLLNIEWSHEIILPQYIIQMTWMFLWLPEMWPQAIFT